MRAEKQIFHFALGKEAPSLLATRLGNIPIFECRGTTLCCVFGQDT